MKAMLENWSTYDLEVEVSIMHFCVYFSVYFNIVCDVWWRDILHWFIGHKMGLEILWMSSDNKNISNFKICNRNGDWNVIFSCSFTLNEKKKTFGTLDVALNSKAYMKLRTSLWKSWHFTKWNIHFVLILKLFSSIYVTMPHTHLNEF